MILSSAFFHFDYTFDVSANSGKNDQALAPVTVELDDEEPVVETRPLVVPVKPKVESTYVAIGHGSNVTPIMW